MKPSQKILIVDDRQENLYALRKVLDEVATELVEANNGNDALTASLHHDFALAILDVQMPGMDGYELASLLRGDARTRGLPIIFMTAAYGEEEQVFKGYESGAVDYIVKPYEPRVLLSKVRVFLELHRVNTDLAEKVEALAASETRFRGLVMAIPDIVYRADPEGRFTFLNDAVRVLGYRPEELLGTHLSRIMQPGDALAASHDVGPEDARRLSDWPGTGAPMPPGLEIRLLPRAPGGLGAGVNAETLVAEVNSSGLYGIPLGTGQSVFLGTVGVIRDITERKRSEAELTRHREHLEDLVRERTAELEHHRHHLEELVEQRTAALLTTEARASHILQSSADGLYGIDASGLVSFINAAACKMLGYRAEEVSGRKAHLTFHHSKPDGSPYPIEECPAHSALLDGQEVRIDGEVYWHADGRAVPVMYAMHPTVKEGNTVTCAVISFVDMSEQRAAERAHELAVIAAENLARLRSEFLANMSHEIRTPLNGVLGFAEIGRRNCQDAEKARNAFNQILISGKRLLGVVNDILDFSKIEAGKLSMENTEVPLIDVVRQAVEIVGALANAKRLALRVKLAPDLPRTVLGDPLRLGQVLLNLLSNAIKFTEAGSVTLLASRQGEQLVFKVSDTGIGMNEEQLGRLFKPFQQADGSTTRHFGGTGLGLAITKRILELMGGSIRVESSPGAGSSFEFSVPCVQAASGTEKPAPVVTGPAGDKPLAGLSILAAEDDPVNQAMLEAMLVEEGARVVMVDDGNQAVERVSREGREAYDLVLMDVQMPQMDGLEATRRILALAPSLPIIGQTAHAMPGEKAQCLAAGMVEHIAKPLESAALVSAVLQHVSARRGQP